ncbi:hypothetical protein BOQ63_024450 [Streptomyces viridifaciens]|nr:hypothetical protein BOQ63_024450 [Streptomyces viridifaciens]
MAKALPALASAFRGCTTLGAVLLLLKIPEWIGAATMSWASTSTARR